MQLILYQYGAGKRLGKYDQVDQLFRHRRATVSLGYIGLYEVATVFLWSKEHNPEAKQITDRYHQGYERQEECLTSMMFSIYSTMSESLTDRFCRLDGEICKVSDITDKEYYTNSFHYDKIVRTQPHLEKLDLVSISRRGRSVVLSITCGIPLCSNKNPKALEGLDYALWPSRNQ